MGIFPSTLDGNLEIGRLWDRFRLLKKFPNEESGLSPPTGLGEGVWRRLGGELGRVLGCGGLGGMGAVDWIGLDFMFGFMFGLTLGSTGGGGGFTLGLIGVVGMVFGF